MRVVSAPAFCDPRCYYTHLYRLEKLEQSILRLPESVFMSLTVPLTGVWMLTTARLGIYRRITK